MRFRNYHWNLAFQHHGVSVVLIKFYWIMETQFSSNTYGVSNGELAMNYLIGLNSYVFVIGLHLIRSQSWWNVISSKTNILSLFPSVFMLFPTSIYWDWTIESKQIFWLPSAVFLVVSFCFLRFQQMERLNNVSHYLNCPCVLNAL